MDMGGWGQTLYRYRSEPALRAALQYSEMARKAGMAPSDLALRWVRQRPAVTTSLVGCTAMSQLEADLAVYRKPFKPLDYQLSWEIDRVHMANRLPIFSSEHVGSDWNNEGEIGERIP
mmetsp:Transcript_17344/g.25973  ORF Transcript_17344/g.25973 Transcript_17344/m.25973 type:complete len:118 (+) Transcript_17344:337-690(+)